GGEGGRRRKRQRVGRASRNRTGGVGHPCRARTAPRTAATAPESAMITLTIGRKSDCDIVLKAETISRRHAELHVVPEGRFIIEDCGSTSGTFLKDDRSWRRISRATVTADDIVKLGDLQVGIAEL